MEPKQAIILIHGIGEQRPMDTAITFAKTISRGAPIRYKPSRHGLRGEINRVTVPKNDDTPRTDIYEYYWAHQFRDNKLSTINNWIFSLARQCAKKWLKTPDAGGNAIAPTKEKLILVIALGYLTIILGVATALVFAATSLQGLAALLIGLYFLYYVCVSSLLFGYAADAAKYLSNHPDNIDARGRVRSGAIDLLRELNDTPEYNRILIVGHSLGSVIGLDAMTQYWHEVCDKPVLKPDQPDPLTATYHQLMGVLEKNPDQIADYQEHQERFRRILCDSQINWKISDFVTVGSPLSFANFLLAKDDQDFHFKTRESRQLMKSPPAGEQADHLYLKNEEIAATSVIHPTKSAAFLFTRWTNLHGTKDPIGGKVRPLFGDGINDICVKSTSFVAAHTEYFSGKKTPITDKLMEALMLSAKRQPE